MICAKVWAVIYWTGFDQTKRYGDSGVNADQVSAREPALMRVTDKPNGLKAARPALRYRATPRW